MDNEIDYFWEDKEHPNDKMALVIGRMVLKYIDPLVVSVSGHIQEKGLNGKLILSYTGTFKEVKE